MTLNDLGIFGVSGYSMEDENVPDGHAAVSASLQKVIKLQK